MNFELKNCKNIIIFGAGHGIGLALVKELLIKSPKANIYATYRIEPKAQCLKTYAQDEKRINPIKLDPLQEEELENLMSQFKEQGVGFDLVFNSIGFLHNEKMMPEKSLKDLTSESLLESFKINSLIPALIAKYSQSLFSKSSPCALINLSAKVGSIEDNKMGGWYSYRASKAALNMIIKTTSLEFQRRRMNCLVLAIHPGTTRTELSAPFIKNTNYQLHSCEETAKNLLQLIQKRPTKDTGKFLSWDGEELPW